MGLRDAVVAYGVSYGVLGDQGVGQKCHGESRGRPTGSPGSRGRPAWSQRVKGKAYRVPGGQGVGLSGPSGSRGGPAGSQGVKR